MGLRAVPVKDPNRVDVARAIELFTELNSWPKVAARLRRPNGMHYTAQAVGLAVRRHDLGLDGSGRSARDKEPNLR
jgi:hypothetical protein